MTQIDLIAVAQLSRTTRIEFKIKTSCIGWVVQKLQYVLQVTTKSGQLFECHMVGTPATLELRQDGSGAYDGEIYIEQVYSDGELIMQKTAETCEIDWSKAPEDATHCDEYGGFYYKAYNSTWHKYNAGDGWTSMHEDDTAELSATLKKIPRTESIVDVARSIEAARAQVRKHGHYFKDVSGVDQIDVYSVLRLFEVTDPCLQHIVKKALCAGKRGAKDFAKDVQEIADTAARLVELERGK